MSADLMPLLRDELRKRLADTMNADWLGAVNQLAEKADREYVVVLAFARCLEAAFAIVKRFPAEYERWRDGKPPSQVLAPSPPAQRPPGSPTEDENGEPWRLMTDDERKKILLEAATKVPPGLRETFLRVVEGSGEKEE